MINPHLPDTPLFDYAKRCWKALSHLSGISAHRNGRLRHPLMVLYHGVDGQVDTVAELEKQLLYLARHFHVVPIDYLGRPPAEHAGKRAGKPPAIVTFDDGLRNNFHNVVPLLVKHNLPATFFVCPQLVERGAWLWNHEARARLEALGERVRQSFLARFGILGNRAADAIEWMKTLPLARRDEATAYLRRLSPNFAASPAQHDQYDVMSWREIEALPALVTVGSHTASHPILTGLAADELAQEVADSKAALEARLQRPVDYFAYPNGALNAAVVHQVRQHYKAAVTSDTGHVEPHDDPFLFKRVSAAPRTGIAQFAWSLHRSER